MLQDNSISISEYHVPLNFIPGETKPYPSPIELRKITQQLLNVQVRRSRSHSNFIRPLADYIKRVGCIESPFSKYQVQRIDTSPGDKKSHIHTTDCKPSKTLNIHKNMMADLINNCNSKDEEEGIKTQVVVINQFPSGNMDIIERYSDFDTGIGDSFSELSASLPDLLDEELKRNSSIRSRRENKSSIDIYCTITDKNEDVHVWSQVEDELRSKLPKTFHATASIGLMNPMCLTGGVRRNTIADIAPRPRKKKMMSPFRKFNSIPYDNIEGYRKKSIFAKLLSSQKPDVPEDNMYGHPTVNSSPSLFTRAESYAKGRTPRSEDNADSSSSVD